MILYLEDWKKCQKSRKQYFTTVSWQRSYPLIYSGFSEFRIARKLFKSKEEFHRMQAELPQIWDSV